LRYVAAFKAVVNGTLTRCSRLFATLGVGIPIFRSILASIAACTAPSAASLHSSSESPCVLASVRSQQVTTKPPSVLSGVTLIGKVNCLIKASPRYHLVSDQVALASREKCLSSIHLSDYEQPRSCHPNTERRDFPFLCRDATH